MKVTQGSKYAMIWLNVLIGKLISQKISEFTIINRLLNMYHTIHSDKLMSTY